MAKPQLRAEEKKVRAVSERRFELALSAYRQHLMEASQNALEAAYPAYVKAFVQHYGPGSSGGDFIKAARAVASIPTPKWDPWRKLLLDIVDLEFGVIRTIDSVRALNIVPPPDALTALGIGRGRWVDYHIALWSLSARAQIQRTEDLVQLVRWCDKAEHESGDLRSPDTLAPLEPFKAYIKSIRDPYAHAGGYIEGVAKDGHLERAVLSSLWPDAAELLDGFERWHEKWAKAVAHQHLLLFDAEGLVFEKVDACVQWASWV